MKIRQEQDSLGTLDIPADAYWGIHTERALRNFAFSNRRVNPALIRAMATVKQACCQANGDTRWLDTPRVAAITQACEEIRAGQFADQFPLDALQGGAGTSVNMNLNEVIANRAIELMGGQRGEYALVSPLAHVNLHQSTNDTFPTAIRVAAIAGLRRLSEGVARLQGVFQSKEKEFARIVKIGRTELQEAVPITLGAEFAAFAEAIARDRWRVFKSEERLRVVNIGGTAVGTGLAAPRDYIFLVIEKLREITGMGLARGENLPGETAHADAFVEVSGILKAQASNLIKIANDLRLLNMLDEIWLPAIQTGSSIMPGKINPVMMEAAIQIGIKAIANDLIITEVTSRGTLQINEFLPLLADALLENLDLLTAINEALTHSIQAITANEAQCQASFDASQMIVTALVPRLGYQAALDVLHSFRQSKATNMRLFLEQVLGAELVAQTFSPSSLTALGFKDERNSKG